MQPNGKTLTIKKKGKGRNMTGIFIDNKKSNGYFVSHDLLKTGGIIEVTTKE